MLLQGSDDMEDVLDISSENLALLKEEAQMVDGMVLMRYIRIFSDLSSQVRYAVQKRILVEIALIKLCKPEMERDYDSLAERVAQIEQKLEKGIFMQQPEGVSQGGTAVSKEREAAGGQISDSPALLPANPE